MKTTLLQIKGKVAKILSNATYNVKVEHITNDVMCYLCGKMNKRFIKLEIGDEVMVEMSPTDCKKGRIIKRLS